MNNNENMEVNNSGLYRSINDKMIGGVCGGFANYFGIDSTIVRIIWLFFTLFGGIGLLAYFVCLVIMRENPNETMSDKPGSKNVGMVVGAGLIMFGLAYLSISWRVFPFNPYRFRFFRPWFFNWDTIFPLLIIGAGAYYIYYVLSKEKKEDNLEQNSRKTAKQFYRSRDDRMIGGVCSGIAKYLEIDVVFVRLFWVLLTFFSGFLLGVIAYIVLLVIIPEADFEVEQPK